MSEDMVTVRVEFSMPKWAVEEHWGQNGQSLEAQKRWLRFFVLDQAIDPQIETLILGAKQQMHRRKMKSFEAAVQQAHQETPPDHGLKFTPSATAATNA